MIGQCRHCLLRREVRTASRKGGGNYRRAGRWYRSSICEECARNLLSFANVGGVSVAQWSIASLNQAVRAFERGRP